mgnify:CR=1 FL=1
MAQIKSIEMKGVVPIGKRIEIHILLPILIAISIFGGYFALFSLSWFFAILHEFAHILVGRMLKIKICKVTFQPFGICAKLKESIVKSPVREIVMAFAGPILSFILWGIFAGIYRWYPIEIIGYCSLLNLSLFLINLLPCLPLDGGRILRAILTLGSNAVTAWRIVTRLSFVIVTMLLSVSAWFLIMQKFNFSFLMIGAFLLGNLTVEQRNISVSALREILHNGQKLDRDDLNGTCIMTAYTSTPARRILHRLSYHKYHIVKVINDKNEVIKTVTESQILNALLNKGIRIKMGEV